MIFCKVSNVSLMNKLDFLVQGGVVFSIIWYNDFNLQLIGISQPSQLRHQDSKEDIMQVWGSIPSPASSTIYFHKILIRIPKYFSLKLLKESDEKFSNWVDNFSLSHDIMGT